LVHDFVMGGTEAPEFMQGPGRVVAIVIIRTHWSMIHRIGLFAPPAFDAGSAIMKSNSSAKMPETSVQQDTQKTTGDPVSADIVVGILSYNSATSISGVIGNVRTGIETYFPGSVRLLVNADGGSKDGTPALALESSAGRDDFIQIAYPVYPVQKLAPEYMGVPGKINALQAVFGIASERNAKACVIIDSNVRSLTPDWMDPLVRPVIENGFDFVSPCYLRHKYEGTLLNGIVSPLTRALYGKRIQQPIGGDFALSLNLVNDFRRQLQMEDDTAGTGIDVWITTHAVCSGFRVAQALLGPRVLDPSEPAPEVSSLLAQTLGWVFMEMNRTASIWQRVKASQEVPTFGSWPVTATEPAPVDINPLLQSFRLGYQSLLDIWRLVLPPATLVDLKRMSLQTAETFRFDDMLWARVIYDFALAWRIRIMDRDHLLRALTPLYLGWVASYIRSVRDATPEQVQDRIEALGLAYESQKGYLISRWRWPDRFNP
jgi:glucosylglycerate synthase